MKMRLLVISVAYLLGILIGGYAAVAYNNYQEPYCPTEDSCTPDYYNGQWHIKEDTP